MQTDKELGPRKPDGEYYYLFAIAVRRQHQGKGIGHDLMLPTIQRIDDEGASAYIESSNRKNLTFYQRFGFEILEEVELSPGGPSMWTLWREGRGKQVDHEQWR
jgi:GNAT superfamily N-acetyltransferase